jgi:hypothetical protein
LWPPDQAPEVVLEATWSWYWAADVIAEAGGRVHLAHPLGIKGFENRRVKSGPRAVPVGSTISSWQKGSLTEPIRCVV